MRSAWSVRHAAHVIGGSWMILAVRRLSGPPERARSGRSVEPERQPSLLGDAHRREHRLARRRRRGVLGVAHASSRGRARISSRSSTCLTRSHRRDRGIVTGFGRRDGRHPVWFSSIYDFTVGRALAERPSKTLTIELIGHQWWWEVQYIDPDPSKIVVDANELHIPVGEPVQVKLKSRDVIHSFWVPNIIGKRDLIPGYTSSLFLNADKPGVYRAQCAEFCGAEHAKMALTVVVHSRADFADWLTEARAPAAEPNDSSAKAGEQVFLAGPCSSCHAITGVAAYGTVGPNLTHLASRQDHRRRHVAQHARQSRRLGRRSAVDQARRPHAVESARAERSAQSSRLSGDAQVTDPARRLPPSESAVTAPGTLPGSSAADCSTTTPYSSKRAMLEITWRDPSRNLGMAYNRRPQGRSPSGTSSRPSSCSSPVASRRR